MGVLNDAELAAFAADHPGWSAGPSGLEGEFTFADFTEAFSFMTRIALMAERANHHPDMSISWNRLTVRLVTHSAGGVTDTDTALAVAIDRIPRP